VALLAEALQGHPTGQFRDLFRVFERAFALPAGVLVAPLHAFLHDRYGYTEEEIEKWRGLRHAATHADVRRRFVVEADVRPVLARVKQAAYDVLFNKESWRDQAPARRDLWSPTGWTSQPSGEVKVLQHSTGRLEAKLLDQFSAYPTDLEGAITALPAGWWAPVVIPTSPERPIEVIPVESLPEAGP